MWRKILKTGLWNDFGIQRPCFWQKAGSQRHFEESETRKGIFGEERSVNQGLRTEILDLGPSL